MEVYSMETSIQLPTAAAQTAFVKAGEDRYGQKRGLGIDTIDFKVTSSESSGVFVVEITMHTKGGPVRHVHYNQDEWWYVVTGEFVVEIGQERFVLGEGDSVWGPRGVPHAWANVSFAGAKMVAQVSPAGQLEAFFLETTKTNQLPGVDSELFRKYGFDVVGPPLPIG